MSDAPDWEGFGRAIIDYGWPVGDIDGCDLFETALKYGIIREIPGGFNPDNHCDPEGLCPEDGDPWYEYNFPYTRSDHALALVAAAYDAAAAKCRSAADKVFGKNDDMELAYLRAVSFIRALTPADAVEAQRKRDARIYDEALEAAAGIADAKHEAAMEWASRYVREFDGETDSYCIAQEIRALRNPFEETDDE